MNFTQLKNLIKNAKNEIALSEDVVLEESEKSDFRNGIIIDHDLKINGNGHVIDARGATVFYIENSDVTIKNLSIKNAAHKFGGAIYLFGNSLRIENCDFTGCEAKKGGAIHLGGNSLSIINSIFTSCSAKQGGAIYTEKGFGDIESCRFIKNFASATYGGGAIYNWKASFDIRNSCFEKNIGDEYGGAVCNHKDMTLTNSSFSENYVKMVIHPEINPNRGGAIFNDGGNLTVKSCDFSRNDAEWHGVGGAICNESGNCTAQDSIFIENTQGCTNSGNFTAENCIFADDGFNNSGGYLTIIKSGFIDKDKIVKPDISMASTLNDLKKNLKENGEKTIDAFDLLFFKDEGRYVLSNSGVCKMISTRFEKHHIINNRTLMYLLESEKDDLIGQIENDIMITKGGLFFINDSDIQSMDDFVKLIEDESSDEILLDFDVIISYGKGPINIGRDNITINGKGHLIDANFSSIFNITANNVTLKNFTFKNGLADAGSVITNRGDNLTVSNCEFLNNRARHGGAIYNYGRNLQLEKSTFNANSLSGNGEGGSLFNNEDASGFIMDCQFISSIGGAVHNEGKLTVKYSKFIRNNASFEGGAICNKATLNVEKSTFTKNASKSGGSIKNYDDLSVSDCVFQEGKSDSGAGIFNFGKILKVERSKFIKNSVVESGGAIYNSSKSDLMILNDCYFEDNLVKERYGFSRPADEENYSISSYSKSNYIINCEFIASYGGDDIHADNYRKIDRFIENGTDYINGLIENAEDNSIELDSDIILDSELEIRHDNLIINGNGHLLFNFKDNVEIKIKGNNIIFKDLIFGSGKLYNYGCAKFDNPTFDGDFIIQANKGKVILINEYENDTEITGKRVNIRDYNSKKIDEEEVVSADEKKAFSAFGALFG